MNVTSIKHAIGRIDLYTTQDAQDAHLHHLQRLQQHAASARAGGVGAGPQKPQGKEPLAPQTCIGCSLYVLYWYQRTNTGANVQILTFCWEAPTSRHTRTLTLLAFLVQKYNK